MPGELKPPFRLLWARHFRSERIGTCVEPIIGEGKLFIATHNGNLYALDAQTGKPLWRFHAWGAFLHSPAFAQGLVIAGNTDGFLYAVDSRKGNLRWRVFGGWGGFASSPTIAQGKVFIGSRSGKFLAVELSTGKLLWEKDIGVPIRQTASFSQGRVFLTAEDMRVRCWSTTGKLLWISQPLVGQTARDYYPIVFKRGDKKFLIIRTNPVLNMAQLIAQDRRLICQNAGIDDSDWRNIEAWTKSESSKGTPELWEKEQALIIRYLKEHPSARSFFLLDAESGKEVAIPPVLWTGGCQGVGNMPIVLPDGRVLLMYRTAYGNWNLGVAPLVALGIWDPSRNRITPLFHKQGAQPPWNTFWGTADESQNFLLLGNTLLIIHQDTLSGFDLKTNQLFPIWGERDSWGGLRNLPWARNEWHGPARGGVAVVENRIYWQVGSRILCLAMGEEGKPAEEIAIEGEEVPTNLAPPIAPPSSTRLKEYLAGAVEEVISTPWQALYVEPGLAGREFFFEQSGEVFEALAWAYPHLPRELQRRVKDYLARQWEEHPPYSFSCLYDLKEGKPREWSAIPSSLRSARGEEVDPFDNIYAILLYAERCGEWERVKRSWAQIKRSFEDFKRRKEGKVMINRHLASLIAFQKIAERVGDWQAREEARREADMMIPELVEWWEKSKEEVKLPIFQNIGEWDEFIGSGDSLFFSIHPHRAKLALFQDLTPEVASLIMSKVPFAFERIWQTFQILCPTWYLVGEERQVHYGENFLDPPDFPLSAFKAEAWLKGVSREELASKLDLPFCKADLYFIIKIAILLSRGK